mmetsp:Transcript_12063/g.18160  ORF Transcript_12063/g.18160 Transcript_12063/m.18160 type:complete len:99 (-) Transcript_12063:197-493(-)
MNELGLLGDQKIELEHTIILATTAALEKPIKKILQACSSSSERTMRTVEVVGYGIAAYLVLAGIAKVVEAVGKQSSSSTSTKRSSGSSSNSSSKEKNR